MTQLEEVLIACIWVIYGVYNSWQHDWFEGIFDWFGVVCTICFAPIALLIRIVRGVFFWKGKY